MIQELGWYRSNSPTSHSLNFLALGGKQTAESRSIPPISNTISSGSINSSAVPPSSKVRASSVEIDLQKTFIATLEEVIVHDDDDEVEERKYKAAFSTHTSMGPGGDTDGVLDPEREAAPAVCSDETLHDELDDFAYEGEYGVDDGPLKTSLGERTNFDTAVACDKARHCDESSEARLGLLNEGGRDERRVSDHLKSRIPSAWESSRPILRWQALQRTDAGFSVADFVICCLSVHSSEVVQTLSCPSC